MFKQADLEQFDKKLNNLDDETSNFLRYLILCLKEWESESLPRTIALAIAAADMRATLLGAAAPIRASTSPLSQSDPVATPSGPAELNCECVKPQLDVHWHRSRIPKRHMVLDSVECKLCGASVWLGKIAAPVAPTTSSTSVKPDSSESADHSQ